jgi:hypothetical protein
MTAMTIPSAACWRGETFDKDSLVRNENCQPEAGSRAGASPAQRILHKVKRAKSKWDRPRFLVRQFGMKPPGVEICAIRPGQRTEFQSDLREELRGGQGCINSRIGAGKDS